MNAGNDTGINACYLAKLAALLMCRQSSPAKAVQTAWELIEEAKDKLEGFRLKELANSPEAQAEFTQRRAEQLANLHILYEKGVHLITGVKDRWSGEYGALNWFKKFLRWKAAKQEATPIAIEARVEAYLSKYRAKGFTGTETKKLQGEFTHWRNKGNQGRVKKKKLDGRLRERRGLKKARQGEEKAKHATKAWEQFNTGKPKWEQMNAVQADAGRGKKISRRDSETAIGDADAPNL